MSNHKLTEKQLKQPDRFQKLGFRFLNWALNAKRTLILTSLSIVLAIVAYGAWHIWDGKNTDNRRNELADIEKLYGDELEKPSEKSQQLSQELQALGPVPTAETMNPDPKAAPIQDPNAAKRKELEAAIEAIKPDHTESLAKFRTFHEKYPNTTEAAFAGTRAASIMLNRGEKEAAEKLLQTLLATTKHDVFYQYQSRLSLIGIWQDSGRFDEAIKAADELISLVKDEKALKAQAMLVKGNILVVKGDDKAAKAVYDDLISQFPDSREAGRTLSLRAML